MQDDDNNNRKMNCTGSKYNQALVTSMAAFVDSMWIINIADEKVCVMIDHMNPDMQGKVLTLEQIRGLITGNSKPGAACETEKYYYPMFLKSLESMFSYESVFYLEDKEHIIQCNMTPGFDEKGDVEEVIVCMKDIQNQLDEEAELTTVRSELDRYLAGVSCGILQYEKDTSKIVYVNETALKILGYSSVSELQDDDFDGVSATMLQADAGVIRRLADSISTEEDLVECEYSVVHKDGTVVDCYSTMRLFKSPDGKTIIQRSMIDITDSRRNGRLYEQATDILSGAQMGLWYFILDEGEPKFVMDANTATLVGGPADMTPEEAYVFWFDRVDEEYKPQVLASVIKMRAGMPAEVVYPYHHPSLGEITVRCGGVLDQKYAGTGLLIRGYHQDITEYNNRLLKQIEISEAIQKHFDGVFEFDLSLKTVKILSDSHDYFKAYMEGETDIDKVFAPMKYAICSHSKEAYDDVTNVLKLKEVLVNRSSFTVEVESITMGWLRITTIPSSISMDGEIEKCIQLVENIEGIKKRERTAKKELDESLQKERKEREMLNSIAEIYDTVYVVDLAKHTVEELNAVPEISAFVKEHIRDGVQNVVWGVTQKRFCEEHVENMMQFTRLANLGERMKGKLIISTEAIDVADNWYRISFIRVGSKDERLTKVILVSQNIDEEKRREETFRVMSHTDELTGLYNRHAYDEMTKKIQLEGIGTNLWYVDVDINGLKSTNDSKGHAAGDELICGVADTLKKAFGAKGKIFRMGGDEFIAAMRGTEAELKEALAELDMAAAEWHGKLNDSLSFSKGIVCSAEIPNCTISLLEQESDRRMYDEKKEYHRVHDRRTE